MQNINEYQRIVEIEKIQQRRDENWISRDRLKI